MEIKGEYKIAADEMSAGDRLRARRPDEPAHQGGDQAFHGFSPVGRRNQDDQPPIGPKINARCTRVI